MMATQSISLREAWLIQAEWWDAASVDGDSGKVTAQPKATGLCSTIPIMTFRKQITEKQERQMLAALPDRKPAYCWPTTPEGAKARAAFCREQANKASKVAA